MNRRNFAALLSAGCVAVALAQGPAAEAASETEIKPGHFKYGTVRYFRGKAENVRLASYGEKKTPVGNPSHLAVQSTVGAGNLAKVAVQRAGTFSIDWSRYTKSDVEAGLGLKYFKVGASAGVSFSYETARSAQLQLLKFYLDEGAAKKLLNQHADSARSYLKDEGADGRFVSEVWVVVDATLANAFSSATSISAETSTDTNTVNIKAKASNGSSETITLGAGTTFAYALMKVKKWNNGKTQIENLETDYEGIN